MTEYRVEYSIDVDAETPEEAAKQVAGILAGGGAGRGVYQVRESITGQGFSGNEIQVDLSLIECNNCKRKASDGADLGHGRDEDLCYECAMRAEGYALCPNCDQWRNEELGVWNLAEGKVIMCSSCEHNARRSGWEPGQ